MQQALRPYVTAGIALVGASMIAVTPLVAPPPGVQVRPVQLVDAWSDLFTNTTANLDNIASNANSSDITQVFSALFTNPLGVIDAITNLDPTVTTGTVASARLGGVAAGRSNSRSEVSGQRAPRSARSTASLNSCRPTRQVHHPLRRHRLRPERLPQRHGQRQLAGRHHHHPALQRHPRPRTHRGRRHQPDQPDERPGAGQPEPEQPGPEQLVESARAGRPEPWPVVQRPWARATRALARCWQTPALP